MLARQRPASCHGDYLGRPTSQFAVYDKAVPHQRKNFEVTSDQNGFDWLTAWFEDPSYYKSRVTKAER